MSELDKLINAIKLDNDNNIDHEIAWFIGHSERLENEVNRYRAEAGKEPTRTLNEIFEINS